MPNPLRKMAVSGSFYPNDCQKLKAYFEIFNQRFSEYKIKKEILNIKPKALLVPHAGYVYSGFTANFAYRLTEKLHPKRIVILGPSHHVAFEGISGSFYEAFETPCGEVKIDSDYLILLAKAFPIGFKKEAHKQEHSTEVQMPFLQHYFPKVPIIELIYGQCKTLDLVNILVHLLESSNTFVIVSSDLSHFYPMDKALKQDNLCKCALATLDTEVLHQGCEACGFKGIEALIEASKNLKLSSKLLDYRTSADASGDKKSVVGYLSAMVY